MDTEKISPTMEALKLEKSYFEEKFTTLLRIAEKGGPDSYILEVLDSIEHAIGNIRHRNERG